VAQLILKEKKNNWATPTGKIRRKERRLGFHCLKLCHTDPRHLLQVPAATPSLCKGTALPLHNFCHHSMKPEDATMGRHEKSTLPPPYSGGKL